MLALKLLLVPAFVLLVSLAGRRYGPSMAGWLAGLPVVAGPILFFLAWEQGPVFAHGAAVLGLSAVAATVSFCLAYAHACRRLPWPLALAVSVGVWVVMALLLSALPPSPWLALAVAAVALLLAPHLSPQVAPIVAGREMGPVELAIRVAAGAALTLGVTLASERLGPVWSGLLAVFPVLTLVLAVFSHRGQGAAYTAALLRALVTGLYAFAAFCFVLAHTVPHVGVLAAFGAATLAALVAQAFTRKRR